MGVLNVTPDSFSDGGRYFDPDCAVARALEMVAEGAAIIDVGGESTRPGAPPVSEEEELRRVVPVIRSLRAQTSAYLSIDTSKPAVMRSAVDAGADIINDVRSLQMPGALAVAASTGAAICLMHMQGEPATMQADPHYEDVVSEVKSFLLDRVFACTQAGIARARLLVDPGIGFGKRLEHNVELLAHLSEFVELRLPLLVGVSRKSTIGKLLDRPADQRLFGAVALATASVLAGAKVVRSHDVAATRDAIKIAQVLLDAGYESKRE
jgi:dihydropteroate synthase